MADVVGNENEDSRLDLRCLTTETERGSGFWNSSVVEMKFSVEKRWIKCVRKAENKPNYGMAQMDGQLEEVIGNKLELAGPLIDSYLKEIGKCMASKLNRSKATGLVNPVVLFFPWAVFRHVLTLVRGYSGDVTLTHSRLSITITERRSLVKLFSPSRFSGENFIAHRHFKKVPSKSGNKLLSVFHGRSLVVVTRNTPFKMDYYMKTERLTVTFYVQRCTADDFPVDTSLQALMNRPEE
ncbi:uncharacterized protein [Montipora capricornis]|uniref:uncharacterized protein n=1 Tax=Montipora capricornis TaxID=246305 RepID=UPI0035F20448